MNPYCRTMKYIIIRLFRIIIYTSVLNIQNVLISWSWNRGVPLYIEVSSFHGIEGFYGIQKVGIDRFHCI